MPTFKEHASADMHCSVMIPSKKKRAANPCDYAPIAKALAETCMDAATAESLRKFDVTYVHDGEGKLAFHKINPLCKLEERHAVDLGSGYLYMACIN